MNSTQPVFDHDALHALLRLCCQRTSVQFVKIRRCRRAMRYSVLKQSSDGLTWLASAVCRDHGDTVCILDPFSLKGAAGRKVWRSSRVPLLQRSLCLYHPLPFPSLEIFPKERVPMAAEFFFSKECAIGQAGAGTAEGWGFPIKKSDETHVHLNSVTQDLQPSGLAVAIKTRYSNDSNNGFVLQ